MDRDSVSNPLLPGNQLRTAGVAVLAFAALVALLYFGRTLCITLVISVILAFILDPFVSFVMRLRLPRAMASFVVCTISILLMYFIGLLVYSQAVGLVDDLPAFSQRANELVDAVADRVDRLEQTAYRLFIPKRFQEQQQQQAPEQPPVTRGGRRPRVQQPPPEPAAPQIQEVKIRQERPSIVVYVYDYISSYYQVLLMISFVPFLVYFMLSWRDHIRKSFFGMYEGEHRAIAGNAWHGIADVARAYVVGNFILGVLLSIASGLCFWSWHLPYWILTGPVSGFLSLIPYVGLPLAALPPLISALAVYSSATPYLVIGATVAFFHLLALNLLYPALVGARVHLNPLAVTVALMFWGTIWGGIGLVLAIPITAGMKAVFDNVEQLQSYGKLLGD